MTEHSHHNLLTADKKLRVIISLTLVILVAEVVGGLISHSLALLSDAAHVFVDALAISLSYYGLRQATRPADRHMTFGYHRIGVIVAVGNAILIFAMVGFIFYEAYQRFLTPQEVEVPLMLGVASIGLAVNLFAAFWLRRDQKTSLNVKSAFWHALGDGVSSLGVVIGGIVMLFSGLSVIDPALSIFVGLILILPAWRIFREGMSVLLEAVPAEVNPESVIEVLQNVPGVRDVHDIHIWSISPERRAMSCHIVASNISLQQTDILRYNIEEVLRKRFNIAHTTVQVECENCENGIFCSINIKGDKG